MRIGFDVSQTGRWKAGCGYFADSLIQHLAQIDHKNQYLLYPTFGDAVWDPDWSHGTRRIQQPNVAYASGHRTHEALQRFWRTPHDDLDARLGTPDVVHANNFYCPTGLKRARLVYTLYDLGFAAHPEWTTEENRLTCFDGVFNASLYADHVIAISEYSRRHFLETFPHYAPEQVSVIYPASRFAGPTGVARPERLASLEPGRFWLSVGTIEPRKNHLRLLQAYARWRALPGNTLPLVLAGGEGWLMQDFRRSIGEMGLEGDVRLLGYVDDAALRWLYENCFAACYVSLFEGFGLPVIEAMSLGAAVLASNATSIPEIVQDERFLVDPWDAEAIFEGMVRLGEDNLWQEARALAHERAAAFSWKAAARQTLDCYQKLV